ncbi:hypothetical protein [Alteromonas sp. D210916BOD_24]|uniref:hypothetical protein n=1 Tax=Alteromonas sp. D210916BOD_24 TaxID=3157618 RepID=UPI00399D1175
MTVFLALTVVVVYVTVLWLSISAVIVGYRHIGMSLLTTVALFFSLTVLISFFAPSSRVLLSSTAYLNVFLLGFNEELLKGFCLFLFCGHVLTHKHLCKDMLKTAIWPFVLVISLVETTRLFAQPLIFITIELSELLSFTLANEVKQTNRFFTPIGTLLLASTALTRIAIHFFLCWLFIWSWKRNKKLSALCFALVHGCINIVMLHIALHSKTPVDHIIAMGIAYMIIATSLSIIAIRLRNHSLTEISACKQRQNTFSLIN